MKRILTFILAPIIAASLELIRLPAIENWLKTLSSNTEIGIGVGILVAAFLTHYFTVISPYGKYEKLAKKRWISLQHNFKPFLTQYGEQGIVLNVHISLSGWSGCYWINPKKNNPKRKKFTLLGEILRVIWNDGSDRVNRHFKLTCKQSTCGKAYYNGDKVYGMEFASIPIENRNLNLNAEQIEMLKDLKMVASYAIYSGADSTSRQDNTIIGVLTVESKSKDSVNLITDPSKRTIFYNQIIALSNICSTLL